MENKKIIKINGKEHQMVDEKTTVKDILQFEGKSEDLENYELIKISNENQECLLYSKNRKPGSSLEDPVLLDSKENFLIRTDITIKVNARESVWNKEKISYEEVIKLAFGSFDDKNFPVTFVEVSSNKDGVLVKGDSVKVKRGMIFNVTETNNS